MKLDFKETDARGNFKQLQYGKNYGFDLEEQLKKHPIKELANDDFKKDLIDSLRKGNVQSATFIKDGQEVKQFIEANPQYKNINLYDANMQRLDSRQSQGQKQENKQGKGVKNKDDESEGSQQQKKGRKQHL